MDDSPRQTETSDTVTPGPVPLPALTEFVHPRFFFGFLRAFVLTWLRSRDYRSLLLGIPALTFAAVGAYATWQLSLPPGSGLAAAYERAAVSASQLGSHAESDLMWERLMQLRPDDEKYRFLLATSLADREEFAEAIRHLDVLTGERGYAPAQFWLVQQSRADPSAFPLTEDQQVDLLSAVVEAQPSNAEARRLLAQILVELGDYRVAEEHLLQAAEQHPSLGLPLYELQLHLKRDDLSDGLRHLQRAEEHFGQQVARSPENSQARISWSQTLAHLGRVKEAESILTEGIMSHDSAELRTALTELLLRQAQLLAARSSLNAPLAAEYLTKAAQYQPEHPLLPPLCVTMAGMGARFSDDGLAPVVTYLDSSLESNPANITARLTLAQLLATLGHYDDATELLKPHVSEDTRIQSLLIRIYYAADRVEEAEVLTETMLAELERNTNESPEEPEAVTELANGLIIAKRPAAAMSAIDAFAQRTTQHVPELPQPLRQAYATASIEHFREMSKSAADQDSFSLLRDAVHARPSGGTLMQLIQLIAGLAYADGPFSSQADEMLAKILAEGEFNATIYASLGTLALSAGRLEAAIHHLQLARSLAPRDPRIQNNLALALIRQSGDNASVAFDLCNQALETIPGQPDVLSTRAEVHIARKNWTEARTDLETALRNRQQSALVRHLLIRVCTELNEPELAEEHQKALQAIQEANVEHVTPGNSVGE